MNICKKNEKNSIALGKPPKKRKIISQQLWTMSENGVSHIILNGSMYKWNPASGILNELSDCIL